MTVALPEEAYVVAADVSRQVASRYRGVVDREDLQQEALLWCVRKHHKVWDMFADDNPDGEGPNAAQTKKSVGKLHVSLRRALERYARKEKAVRLGYRVEDEAFYDSGQLDDILEHVFSYQDWQSNPVVGDKVKTGADPATGGNWTAACADVAQAIGRLDFPDQAFIRFRFQSHKTYREIGDMFGRSHEWARQQVEQAKEELLEQLGGESPYGSE